MTDSGQSTIPCCSTCRCVAVTSIRCVEAGRCRQRPRCAVSIQQLRTQGQHIPLVEVAERAPICPGRWGWDLCAGPPGAGHAGSIYTGAAEVQLVSASQLTEQCHVQAVPDTCVLPVAKTPPAGHAAAKAKFLGQLFPGSAGAQHEQDAVEGLLVTESGSAALWCGGDNRQQGLDSFVQLCADFSVSVLSHVASNAQSAFDDDRLLLAARSESGF